MSLLIYPDGTNSCGGYGTNCPKGRSFITPNKKKIGIFTIAVIGLGILLVMKK